MNKIILISLVIFFTICSRSWAEEDNDPYLITNAIQCYNILDKGKIIYSNKNLGDRVTFMVLAKGNIYMVEVKNIKKDNKDAYSELKCRERYIIDGKEK